MPSTYTVNLGIEKPATGEQSGTWGDTTNVNFDILDQAINGAERVTLTSAGSSGSPNSLQITNGATSDGRNKWLEFYSSSDLGGSAFVQLDPNDAEKIVFVRNSLAGSQSVILFQGTYNAARDLEVPAGVDMVVKFDGGGASAATVTDVFTKLRATEITTPTLTAGTADINGGTIDNSVIGGSTAAAVTGTTVVANTSLNIAGDGATVTGIKDEDDMSSNSPTKLATQQSIKAYVDSQVGTVDTWAEVLANGATSGSTNPEVTAGQALKTNTINETSAGSGVTIDSVLLKDDVVNATDVETGSISANDGTDSATIANSTGVMTIASSVLTTTDINGGSIDGTNIGASSAATGAFTTLSTTSDATLGNDILMTNNSHIQWGSASSRLEGNSSGTDTLKLYTNSTENLSITGSAGGAVVVNEGSSNLDFRVESSNNTHMLFVDAGNDRVGVNNSAPAKTLHVSQSGTPEIRIQNSDNNYALDLGMATTVGQIKASADLALMPGGIEKWRVDTSGNVTQTNTSAGAGAGPYLNLHRNSASPLAGDALGIIQFQGEDSVGNLTSYATISSEIYDPNNGTEDGRLVFKTAVTGSLANRLYLNFAETVFNEDSNDLDFRVESSGATHMLFVDAGNNRVGIGESAPDAPLHLTTSSTGSAVILESTGGNNSAGPNIRLYRNSGTPADGDALAKFVMRGNNDAAEEIDYVTLASSLLDVTDGTEDGGFTISTMIGGTSRNRFGITDTELNINEGSQDSDFRVESNSNAHMLFVDAGNNYVIIGGSSLTNAPNSGGLGISASGERALSLQSTSADTLLLFRDSGTTTPPYIGSFGNDLAISGYGGGTPNVGIGITAPQSAFHINQNGGPQATGNMTSGLIVSNGTAGTAIQMGTNDSSGFGYIKSAYVNSSQTGRALLLYTGTTKAVSVESGETVINDDSIDRDFRVESDSSTHALFVDASTDRVGILNSGPQTPLEVTANANQLRLSTASDPTNYHTNFSNNYDSTAPFTIQGYYNGTQADFLKITAASGFAAPVLRLGEDMSYVSLYSGTTERVTVSPTEAIVNDLSNDYDFRVESDGNTHMLFVDAGNDKVVVGSSSGTGLLTVTKSQNDLTYLDVSNTSTTAGTDGAIARLITSNNAGSGTTSADIVKRKNGQFGLINNETDSGAIFYHTLGTTEMMRHTASGTFFNEGSADIDFRVESNSNTHMLFVDAASNEIGINQSSPASTLHVTGRIQTDQFQFSGGDGSATRLGRMFGWSQDNSASSGATWRKVGVFTMPDADFSSIGVLVKTFFPGSNYSAYQLGGQSFVNQCSITRKTTSVTDNADIHGPYNPYIQLHRNSVGEWELQARTVNDNQGVDIQVMVLTSAGGADFDATTSITAGTTGGTVVSADGASPYTQYITTLASYGGAAFNEAGGDYDFRVESDNDANALFVEGSSGSVCFGKNSSAVGTNGGVIDGNSMTLTIGTGNTYHLYDGSNYKFYVNANGGIYNYQNNNVNLSDQREKKNIEALGSQWDALKKWDLKKFHYNSDNDSDAKKVGVIAQDVQVNHPDLISDFQNTEDETRLAVKEQQMMWMAIKALQEAQEKIETLEAKVAALESN